MNIKNIQLVWSVSSMAWVMMMVLSTLLCLSATVNARENLPDFTGLVEKYSPAVVNISTTRKASQSNTFKHRDGQYFDELFKRFFQNHPGFNPNPDGLDVQSLGSGVIIADDGYILTNAHVIEGADEILIKLYDRRELQAQVIGSDKQTDIALLKIDASQLPTVRLGSSKDLKVGAWVVAIGNPFGFDHTVTAGIVSAKGRSFRNENYVPYIQTDVAINPGNSGGPLFNTDGDLVGINSRISSEPGRRSYAGLSFAIPAEVARDVMEQLRNEGQVSRGWLGVVIQDVTPDLASSFGLDKPLGALVSRVVEDGPAHKAKLQAGDIILKLDGQEIKTSSVLPPLVGRLREKQIAKLEIMRNRKKINLEVKIAKLPDQPLYGMTQPQTTTASNRLGLEVKSLDESTKKATGAKYGVLVEKVYDEGPAKDGNLRPGDVIQMMGGQKINTLADFQRQVERLEAGRSVAVLVHRSSSPAFLALRIPK